MTTSTLNLGNVAIDPVPAGTDDFTLVSDLPSRFDLNPLQRTNRVNIRLRAEDIHTLEALALEAGMPFQSFLADVIHKFAGENKLD